jgi:predicted ATPase
VDVGDFPRITSLKIDGFKVFDNFEAKLGPLEVIVGANGAGKSSLFDLLRFLREGMERDIPPEILPNGLGMQVFHVPEQPKFSWRVRIGGLNEMALTYAGEIIGPAGYAKVSYEFLEEDGGIEIPYDGSFFDGVSKRLELRMYVNDKARSAYRFLKHCSFHPSFNVSTSKIRRSAILQQEPSLEEDGRNLSSVLHYLRTEHNDSFEELCSLLRLVLPGFRELTVKARGGPGEVMAFWREEGTDNELTLADLSDGILRFLCWAVLCLHPQPPSLICIDEPELGLHPRVLPLLASLFKRASERTQVILATHSSYFLSQFDLADIAVMRKEKGRAVWVKPNDHKVFHDMLADFGQDEIGNMHITDELEHLA